MDRAIFEFNSDKYQEKETMNFSRALCEHLADVDENNVTKYDMGSDDKDGLDDILGHYLNNGIFDNQYYNYRVFIDNIG